MDEEIKNIILKSIKNGKKNAYQITKDVNVSYNTLSKYLLILQLEDKIIKKETFVGQRLSYTYEVIE